MMDTLTDLERELVTDIGKCYSKFLKVMEANGDYLLDRDEIIHHIHILQRYVLSNAAARAYPGEYRAIGSSLR